MMLPKDINLLSITCPPMDRFILGRNFDGREGTTRINVKILSKRKKASDGDESPTNNILRISDKRK